MSSLIMHVDAASRLAQPSNPPTCCAGVQRGQQRDGDVHDLHPVGLCVPVPGVAGAGHGLRPRHRLPAQAAALPRQPPGAAAVWFRPLPPAVLPSIASSPTWTVPCVGLPPLPPVICHTQQNQVGCSSPRLEPSRSSKAACGIEASRPSPPADAQEVALIGMLAYLSYLCGELLGISGIVSLFCCGVVTSHYVRDFARLLHCPSSSCSSILALVTAGIWLGAMGQTPGRCRSWDAQNLGKCNRSELCWCGHRRCTMSRR